MFAAPPSSGFATPFAGFPSSVALSGNTNGTIAPFAPLAPLPAVIFTRSIVTSIDAFTNAPMLDPPGAVASAATKSKSSMCTAPATSLTVSGISPAAAPTRVGELAS